MIDLINDDCMNIMQAYPDKYFDLAIVDPPYGIGVDCAIHIRKPDRPSTWAGIEKYDKKGWDKQIPDEGYFNELIRVSKKQVIWGGNYFTDFLPPSKCWVFWDKLFDKTFNFSHGELAWTSFNKQLLKVTLSSKHGTNGGKDRIHPTEKPVKLYKWCLSQFAKDGDKILDTHLGSGSIAIACHDLGFDLVAIEIDTNYYNAALKRFKEQTIQMKLL